MAAFTAAGLLWPLGLSVASGGNIATSVAAVVLSVPVLCSVTMFATQSKEKEIDDSIASAKRGDFPKALAVITAAGLFGPAASLLAVVGAPANSVILSTATATACVVAIFKFSTLQGDPDYYV